jgi:hypothetical protein
VIAKTYNPESEGSKRPFKGGKKASENEPICKVRYQQISVTPLADQAAAARILQTSTPTTYYPLTLTVSSTSFNSAKTLLLGALSLLAVTSSYLL